MLPSETMIWQPEFTDKTLSRKPGAVQTAKVGLLDEIDAATASEEGDPVALAANRLTTFGDEGRLVVS
ncbi:phage terminase large subunit family protein, partial [Escherichia coli]|uniref:phage terminase large subunit family protein n=1 Tax=Escherichia coli TaxID=562 RepID=UPI001FCD5D20